MKWLLLVLMATVMFSCQKKIDALAAADSINGEVVESNNAVYPFPCHSISFSTNYPVQPGKVPPFRFLKTQYASGRIRTINMLSRANPNHSAFKPQAWEVIGTFTYWSNKAQFKGTKQLWEYYKTSTGSAAKKSIIKKNVDLTFQFWYDNPGYWGCCPNGYVSDVINNLERSTALTLGTWGTFQPNITVGKGSDELENYFLVQGNGTTTMRIFSSKVGSTPDDETPSLLPYNARKSISFNLVESYDNKIRTYQPTQNWISLEYTLCEAMGWVWFENGERKSVAVEFYPYGTSYKVVQSQVYKSHKYDSKGYMLSYTYGDNVLQKTNWICK